MQFQVLYSKKSQNIYEAWFLWYLNSMHLWKTLIWMISLRGTWWEFLCSSSALNASRRAYTERFSLDSYTTKWKVLWDGAPFFLMPAPFSTNHLMQNIRGISCLGPTYSHLCKIVSLHLIWKYIYFLTM